MTPIHGPEGSGSGSAKRDEGHGESGNLQERVTDLERRLEKHAVTLQAIFALLSAQGVSDEALDSEIHRVEQTRAHAAQKTCAKCGHVIGRRHMSCVFCGQARVVESPFELL